MTDVETALALLREDRGATMFGAADRTVRRAVRGARFDGRSRRALVTLDVDRGSFGNGMVAMDNPRSDRSTIADDFSDCIVRIAAQQDQAAFETLFKHFAPRLKSFFIKRGGDPALAEEITQETLVTLWKNAEQFDPAKASASTWIFTIARNLSIDRFRQARRPSFDPNDPAFIPDEEEPPDRQLERAEAEQTIRELMNSLSANEKSILMLSFYENHSHGEIAKRLGLPIGTVKSRIRLAFGKLRAALDQHSGAGQ